MKSNTRIVLMNPPWYRLQNASLVHYPPGPAYIAAVLERVGYKPIVWNADYDASERPVIGGTNILTTDELTRKHALYRENLENVSKPIWRAIEAQIRDFAPDIVGISVYSATYKAALNTARIIKNINPATIVIFGGVHPTIDPAGVALQPDVDFVVYGEGEETAIELVNALTEKKDTSAIRGIAFKRNGEAVVNDRRPYVSNLDELPLPARHLLFQAEKYPPTAFQALYGSRGCPFRCIFCGSFNVWGHKTRMRSAESLALEIESVYKTHRTRYFYICDDIFFYDKERALRFCSILREKNLPIFWSLQTRGELMDDELLSAMKKCGGQHIAIGVEVGDERIRKLIKKGNTVDDMREAAKKIHKHGLTMVGFFMFGFPWETREDIQKTVDLLKELDPTIAFPYIVTPAPGTELYQEALSMGLISPHADLEDFYHESPEMCVSANLPADLRETIINKTLAEFAAHNKRRFRGDLFKRPAFYWALLHDFGLLSKPSHLLGYVRDLLIRK